MAVSTDWDGPFVPAILEFRASIANFLHFGTLIRLVFDLSGSGRFRDVGWSVSSLPRSSLCIDIPHPEHWNRPAPDKRFGNGDGLNNQRPLPLNEDRSPAQPFPDRTCGQTVLCQNKFDATRLALNTSLAQGLIDFARC